MPSFMFGKHLSETNNEVVETLYVRPRYIDPEHCPPIAMQTFFLTFKPIFFDC